MALFRETGVLIKGGREKMTLFRETGVLKGGRSGFRC